MPRFAKRVRKLRREHGLTLSELARRLGSFKGYVCSIERGKLSPPSVKMIQKYARVFGQDVKELVVLAWVDKAPPIIKQEAQRFLVWHQVRRHATAARPEDSPIP